MPSGGQNKGQRSFPLTAAQIHEAYLDRDVSMATAARTLGCSVKILWQACKDHGLQAKSNTREIEKGRPLLHKKLADHAWLSEQLESRTLTDIGKELGTVGNTVASYAKRHGLYDGEMGSSASHLLAAKKSPRIHKATQISEDAIYAEYINRDVNMHQACEALQCSPPTLIEAMDYLGIPPKNKLRKIMPMNTQPGEKWRSQNGYIKIFMPWHPDASAGCVLEHRFVAGEKLGRSLALEEVVHHCNRKRDDNRIENLMVLTREEHRLVHMIEDMRRAGEWNLSTEKNICLENWYSILQEQHKSGQDITSEDARLERQKILYGPLPNEPC